VATIKRWKPSDRTGAPKARTAQLSRAATAQKKQPMKRPAQTEAWSDTKRAEHWRRQDRKDAGWGVLGVTLVAVYLGAVWKIDSMMPKPLEQEAGTVVYRNASGEALPTREQKQKQALARFAQSREAQILELHKHMVANARAAGVESILTRLEPYLGGSYGLPKAQNAVRKLLEAEGDTRPEQKLETVLAVHDALDSLAASHYSGTSRYANDYFQKWDLTRLVFNYQFPDRVFHDDLADALKAFIKPYRDHVEKLDPRLQMSGTFGYGSSWQPLRPY
jgi:hypothetical protein